MTRDWDQELSAYIDGELDEAARKAVEKWLATDPAYARRYARMRRIGAMLHETMETPAFQRELRARLEAEAAVPSHGFWRRATAVAAVVTLLAATAVWWLAGPGAPAPTSPQAPGWVEAEGPAVPRETPAERDLPGGGEADEAPAIEAPPRLAVSGSVTGAHPIAVLVDLDTGEQRVHRPGDEVAPGVTLESVTRDGAVLTTAGGERFELAKAPASTVAPLDIAGVWEGVLTAVGEPVRAVFEQDGVGVTAEFSAVGIGETIGFEGALTGNVLQMEVDTEMGETLLRVEGVFSTNQTAFEGEMIVVATSGDGQWETLEKAGLELSRMDRDAGQAHERLNQALRAFEALTGALERYAREHGGAFPAALGDLAPDWLAEEDLAALDAAAELDYAAGRSLWDPRQEAENGSRPDFADILPHRPMEERLFAYEEAVAAHFGGAFPAPGRLLTVRYGDAPFEHRVSTAMRTEYVALDGEEHSGAQLEAMAVTEVASARHLALTVLMFAQEHEGHAPAGWFSVYPGYLQDPLTLASPFEEGTDPAGVSFELVFPAINLDDDALLWEMLAQARPGEAARLAEAYEEGVAPLRQFIPIIVGPDHGAHRVVAFADGHVRTLPPEEFNEMAAPFLY